MRHWVPILTLLAFLTGVIAPACGFMWGGQYSVIEICTAQGIENRVVLNDEQPDDHKPRTADQCSFCFTSAHMVQFVPDVVTLESAFFVQEKQRFQHYEDVLLSRYKSNISSRGPPAFV